MSTVKYTSDGERNMSAQEITEAKWNCFFYGGQKLKVRETTGLCTVTLVCLQTVYKWGFIFIIIIIAMVDLAVYLHFPISQA